MTEERITRTENADGSTSTTHTTVISDGGSNGGMGKWAFAVVLLVAVLVGGYFLSQMSGAEIAKDNAVAEAADQVGNAASQVGEAAEQAGDAVSEAADQVNPEQ